MRRPLTLTATVFIVLALGTACGSDSETGGGPGAGAGSGSSETAKTIEVTVSGDTITPSGDEVDVDAGQPIDLVVTADAPGEIHVHSDPEQEFAYEGTGEPETFSLQIDRPGQVEVESHTLDQLIVKLVVQ